MHKNVHTEEALESFTAVLLQLDNTSDADEASAGESRDYAAALFPPFSTFSLD